MSVSCKNYAYSLEINCYLILINLNLQKKKKAYSFFPPFLICYRAETSLRLLKFPCRPSPPVEKRQTSESMNTQYTDAARLGGQAGDTHGDGTQGVEQAGGVAQRLRLPSQHADKLPPHATQHLLHRHTQSATQIWHSNKQGQRQRTGTAAQTISTASVPEIWYGCPCTVVQPWGSRLFLHVAWL